MLCLVKKSFDSAFIFLKQRNILAILKQFRVKNFMFNVITWLYVYLRNKSSRGLLIQVTLDILCHLRNNWNLGPNVNNRLIYWWWWIILKIMLTYFNFYLIVREHSNLPSLSIFHLILVPCNMNSFYSM